MPNSPKIDKRTFPDIAEHINGIAPYYAAAWKASGAKDEGTALVKIFSRMMELVVQRLNRVPDKSFIHFLEMLGVSLMPAQPARVPVTFGISEGSAGGTFVPARTQVATEETDEQPSLIFETASAFFATSALCEHLYGVIPATDEIYGFTENVLTRKGFLPFAGHQNLQEHVFYIGHDELFHIERAAAITIVPVLRAGSLEALAGLTWEYWEENQDEPRTFAVSLRDNMIVLTKSAGTIQKKTISGIESYWIQCRAGTITKQSTLPVLESVKIKNAAPSVPVSPELGYTNHLPVDFSKDIYPFGPRPRFNDTFYLASREAFSKRGAKVSITAAFNSNYPPQANTVTVLWEYWNGSVWRNLETTKNEIGDFGTTTPPVWTRSIDFSVPRSIAEVAVNGERNYWIRCRLMSGDFGTEEVRLVNGSYTVVYDFHPPVLRSITIDYLLENERDPQYCLAYNNLEYRDYTKESAGGSPTGFTPFSPLPERYPTLYLGFSRTFGSGNISLLFSVDDKEYPQALMPKIAWSSWNTAPRLISGITDPREVVLDSLQGIRIGSELLFEETLNNRTIGETATVESYVDSENKVILRDALRHSFSTEAKLGRRTRLEASDNTEHLTRTGTLEFIGPAEQQPTAKFGTESHWLMGTVTRAAGVLESLFIKGVYPNTVWGEQVEIVKDEILGSSEGNKNMVVTLAKTPVLSEEIWIREGVTIPGEDAAALAAEDLHVITDDGGKAVETWVRWRAVENFASSDADSRHYLIDRAAGTIHFGDGEHGRIPPIGRDNIKATYQTGGGVSGNIMGNRITILKTAIAGIDNVTNPAPGAGGSDTESIDDVTVRGPHLIKHRNRAATREDFERLASSASTYVARTKSFIAGNVLKIIVIPEGAEDKPIPPLGLKQTIKNAIIGRSWNRLLPQHLAVVDPLYREISVTADIVPVSLDVTVPLEKEIRKTLKGYLHPLTGGPEGSGWEFGRGVYLSDLYELLEGIAGVDHVEQLLLNDASADVSPLEEFETVCSGEHNITITMERAHGAA